MISPEAPHELGRLGEEFAVNYLTKKSYRIVDRGFRLFRGEIDIIAYEGQTLVFVEVKTRMDTEFGAPEEYVTPAKQRQIRKIAEGYLAIKALADIECRFDVISLLCDENEGFQIQHFRDAF
jgi:putative endonuclease